MSTRVAPIFPVRDLAAALAYYRELGFGARPWHGGDVRLPEDTEWGQHEGVLVDPDGNMIRFGSPMRPD